MTRHSITLKKTAIGEISATSIGTSALTALASIPGLEDPRVEKETEGQATVSYLWKGASKMETIQEHLAKYGLERADLQGH